MFMVLSPSPSPSPSPSLPCRFLRSSSSSSSTTTFTSTSKVALRLRLHPHLDASKSDAISNCPNPYYNQHQNQNQNQKLSKSAIHRISDKLRHLRYFYAASNPPHNPDSNPNPNPNPNPNAHANAGEIFIPTPLDVPTYPVGSTLHSTSTSTSTYCSTPRSSFTHLWNNHTQPDPHESKEPLPSVAELTLPPHQLRRLRTQGIRLRHQLRVGKPGITEGIVNGIHERWKHSELVKIKCDDLSRINMKRTHQILETKTGGLVVWRSGSIIILYRGSHYKYPYFRQPRQHQLFSNVSNTTPAPPPLVPGVGSRNLVRLQLPGEAKLAQEADHLLDGLGPRFLDWWGLDPKPIDADLLPGLIMGFRKPFRVLPFGINQKLTDSEMTTLRRLGRPLPCHFALGRNRNLQGLAQAMIKLWEKCEIAKIAVKRGVHNTDTEIMAEELKKLTGGTLLSRDSEHIVFYRGKDFLPLAVSTAIEERRKNGNSAKVEEESREERKMSDSESDNKEMVSTEKHEKQMDSVGINNLEAELPLAITKKEKAEKLLEELESSPGPPREEHEKEVISEEERYMLRKVGLTMKAFLLMGRKGVFDGTVENMHLHWKYRELVKIISKEKDIKEVEHEARILESESGGILVAVERIRKGYAIIIYRGKNYQRPKTLRPKSLPNKREAMKRSLKAQRRQSLKLHVLDLTRNEEPKQLMNEDQPSPAHSIQKSNVYIEDSEPTSSGNNDLDESRDNSEVKMGSDVCSTSGTSSHEEENLGKTGTDEIPFKAAPLSNKERLVLRKQALKMRKRPVLAVGRNNVISGVVKTIKTHFQKHSLAIVNIKNRADGTSVQQLIHELEEATGAVLVSREPNKVILYRGWAEGENPGRGHTKLEDDPTRTKSLGGENGDTISSELMEAIRVECGFHP